MSFFSTYHIKDKYIHYQYATDPVSELIWENLNNFQELKETSLLKLESKHNNAKKDPLLDDDDNDNYDDNDNDDDDDDDDNDDNVNEN